ncbi:MAG: hypothetical protein HQ559_13605 [Lentisphaerae bacterium]|nr:hypothetical protein [Lentisphaerota bacterium]
MNEEKKPTTNRTNILWGAVVIVVILALLFVFWRLGAAVFTKVGGWHPSDRLGLCIIAAAILHGALVRIRINVKAEVANDRIMDAVRQVESAAPCE